MGNHRVVLGLVLLVAIAASGCRKTSYGAGCEEAVDLTAPWTGLQLPIEEDKARVCESSASELKLRSHSWNTVDEAQPAFEKALTAAGYTKARCTGQACYYDKDGQTVSVHPMEFKVKKQKFVTVVLTSRSGKMQSKAVAP